MTRKINTYRDLMLEKEHLLLTLQQQKRLIRQDFDDIRQELEPVRSAISTLGKLTTRDTGNWIMNSVANKAIDIIVKKFLLAKSGWLTRIIVPFFVKNYSSHVIADNKEEILDKVFSWVKNVFSSNGKAAHYQEE